MPNIKLISAIGHWCKVLVNVKVSFVLTSIWPLTLNDDLGLDMSPIRMCVLMRRIHMPNIKLQSAIGEKLWPLLKLLIFYLQFDLWPWKITLTLTCHPSKCALNKINTDDKYQVAICKRCKVMANVKVSFVLTWIWPLTLRDDLDLDMSPIRMCILMRRIHMSDIKLLSAIGENLLPMLKLHVFDLQPWRMTLTLIFHPSKCAVWCDTYVCQISSYYLQ